MAISSCQQGISPKINTKKMETVKNRLLDAANTIAALTEGLENKKPSLYLGESEGSDGLHFSLCNPLDTLEGVWVCVEWDEMLDALKGSTTQAESMNAITQIKRVINQYEEWAKITHKEWLSLQD